jgi:3-dehydroquinate synthase
VRAPAEARGLPTVPPRIGAGRALELMQMDKKVLAGAVRLVLLERSAGAIVTAITRQTRSRRRLTEYFE